MRRAWSTTSRSSTTRRARRRSPRNCRKSWAALQPSSGIHTGITPMSTTQVIEGKIVQCIGAVIYIKFPRDNMPRVYDALKLVEECTKSFAEKVLTFVVEQQLGYCVIGTFALGSSDVLHVGI